MSSPAGRPPASERQIEQMALTHGDDSEVRIFVASRCRNTSTLPATHTYITVGRGGSRHRCKKRFYLFWSRFYVINVFLIFETFFIFKKKTLAKFRAASRLTRSTFKITATK